MKKKLRVGILDLIARSPSTAVYARVMNPNFAGIMTQMIAVWCERAGHDVTLVTYTGFEDLAAELPKDIDLLFIGAFSQSAQLAYAISNMFQQRGAVTVLGGPHARCYPEDAARFFDYVLGFTDQTIIEEVLADCAQHRPMGQQLSALRQPTDLPTISERWKFIEQTLNKAPLIKIVPMLGSLGCPYTCSFCIDSTVEYQPLGFEQLREDMKFVLTKFKSPILGWYDPNFGIRFEDYMNAVEQADPKHRMRHIAESSLSLLSEPHLKRLRQNGFQAILPGIESWYDMGNKSKTQKQGEQKMKAVAEHVNMILRYIPYIQTNFVLGLDGDEGAEPFELTKRFLDLAPGSFPAYSLLSAFGRAAPLNLEYQRTNRVLPFPHHFLNNNHAMNVKPKNYEWPEFYDRLIDLTTYSFNWRAIRRRLPATPTFIPKWMNLVRAMSSEGWGRIKYHTTVRRLLDTDPQMLKYLNGESTVLPQFYADRIKNELGVFYPYLPEGALEHDPNAYLKAQGDVVPIAARAGKRAPTAAAAAEVAN